MAGASFKARGVAEDSYGSAYELLGIEMDEIQVEDSASRAGSSKTGKPAQKKAYP